MAISATCARSRGGDEGYEEWRNARRDKPILTTVVTTFITASIAAIVPQIIALVGALIKNASAQAPVNPSTKNSARLSGSGIMGFTRWLSFFAACLSIASAVWIIWHYLCSSRAPNNQDVVVIAIGIGAVFFQILFWTLKFMLDTSEHTTRRNIAELTSLLAQVTDLDADLTGLARSQIVEDSKPVE